MGKGFVQADISTIIEKLAKNVKFLQPVYEAITNSLEAGAKKISIEFFKTAALQDEYAKINGFSITDDGEGFIQKNIDAFVLLWTKNKLNLGCKGSGRFTWLSVYEKIDIVSDIQTDNKRIKIPFCRTFDEDDVVIENIKIDQQKTSIRFSDITKDFYCAASDIRKGVDKRCVADLGTIKDSIIEYLLIKLFLLKQNGVPFVIELKLGEQIETINHESIPTLSSREFTIFSDITNRDYLFTLYYHFHADGKNSKKLYYCSNMRSTKEMHHGSFGFTCPLPNNDSFEMLLCSDYLDGKDDDARSDLTELLNQKQADINTPLLLSNINPATKKVMHEIILTQYPEISSLNSQEEEKAIDSAPYLTPFIKMDTDIIKTEQTLLANAEKNFKEAKIRATQNFERLLSTKSVSDEEFKVAVNQLSLIAAAELGEYILYRDSIIKALNSAILDPSKKEKFIHDIFMPMRTNTFSTDENKHLLSNLWLLDDKFMTYSYAASDETIEAIKADITAKNEEKFKNKNRPDITIFFNTQNSQKNVVVIEFKGANADKYEKKKALTELPDDVAIIKKHIPDVSTIWSYIITSIDDEFKFSIENQDNYFELFTPESSYRAYYKYFPKQNAHEFILDLSAITSDAFARNKVFMDILKKQ